MRTNEQKAKAMANKAKKLPLVSESDQGAAAAAAELDSQGDFLDSQDAQTKMGHNNMKPTNVKDTGGEHGDAVDGGEEHASAGASQSNTESGAELKTLQGGASTTVAQPEIVLHGFWRKATGLHLWIEQTEGHKILTPEVANLDALPEAARAIVEGKRFRRVEEMTLLTPKARLVTLRIPTAAYTPEQAVKVLATLAALGPTNTTDAEMAAIGGDLKWLIQMYKGLEQYVRAGRLSIRMQYSESQWTPMWQLAGGLNERSWLARMQQAAPAVLSINSKGRIAEEVAAELPHWIANALLRKVSESARPVPWHEFISALLRTQPLRRGSTKLVSALNKWRDSMESTQVGLLLSVIEPVDLDDYEDFSVTTSTGLSVVRDDEESAASAGAAGSAEAGPASLLGDVWRIHVQARGSDGSVLRISDALEVSSGMRAHLERVHERMYSLCPPLHPEYPVPPSCFTSLALARQDEDVDIWDAYLTTEDLMEFLNFYAPMLQSENITVLLPKAWNVKETTARLRVQDPADASTESKLGLDQIVEYKWELSVGDVALTQDEMAGLISAKAPLVKLRGEWVVADTTALQNAMRYMEALENESAKAKAKKIEKVREKLRRLSLAEQQTPEVIAEFEKLYGELEVLEKEYARDFVNPGEVSLAELRQLALEAETPNEVEFTGSKWHQALMGGLDTNAIPAPTRVEIPDTVQAELRDYQRRGVDWLHWMASNHFGAVLADDMGLGKTLQLLALEAVEREQLQNESSSGDSKEGVKDATALPTLIVAPTSVVGNWQREAEKFVPNLKVMVHHGSSRKRDEAFAEALENGVALVISSYGTVERDVEMLRKVQWRRVVLDEAQHIKNAATKVSKAVRSLPSEHRVALTGTPVENRLSEMRSILDYCNPGVLGSASFFRNHFARAIERYQDEVRTEQLRALTAPLILRRLKTDPNIIEDLPEKTENILTVPMTREQAALYQAYVDELTAQLAQAEGLSRRALVLSSLTRIKQICNHPAHFLADGSGITNRGRHRSGKVEELMRLLEEAADSGQRVLIFTQYTAFGHMLQPYLSDHFGTEIPFLHGGLSKTKRDNMVEAFQQPDGAPAMVLSLKAGGTGLNLTNASVVVHMDRWWNPAVENQATDRAYRIGQRKDVTVYKMITAGTIEESIQHIIEGKMELASAIVGEGEGWLTELSTEELAMLLSYRGQ